MNSWPSAVIRLSSKTQEKKNNHQTQQLAQNIKLLYLSVLKNILEPFSSMLLKVKAKILTDMEILLISSSKTAPGHPVTLLGCPSLRFCGMWQAQGYFRDVCVQLKIKWGTNLKQEAEIANIIFLFFPPPKRHCFSILFEIQRPYLLRITQL